MLILALLFGAVGGGNSVKAEKQESDFSEIASANTNASWDSSAKTMSWSQSSYNYLSYFMISGIDAVDGYYDLSTWETITITFTLTGTNNGIRVRMKDNTGGDGDWISLDAAGTHTINISDFKKNGSALNYSKIAGIQLSGGNSVASASTAIFSKLYLERGDVTAIVRSNLSNLITLAGKYHSFGKTTESFAALTSQITTAEGVRDNNNASVDDLSAAISALQDKIDALQLLPGYSNLTIDKYKEWQVVDEKIVEKGNGQGTIHLFEELTSGGVPYGHTWGSGDWQNFADLSDYSKLYITGKAGERIRGYFNKSPEGTGTVDLTLTFNEQGVAEFDFVNSTQFSSADYIHLIFLKCPEANSGITSLLLYDGKHELRDAMTKAGLQSSFAKTEDSYKTFTSTVETANLVLSNRTSSEESIANAKNDVLGAINNFVFVDGYTKLTKNMFKTWNSATAPTTGTSAINSCYYNVNSITGQPYGDGNVNYLYYADLSEFNSLTIIAPAGTPRVLLNRNVNNGNYNATEANSQMIEIPKSGEWTDRYYSVDGTKFMYDLSKISTEKGYAHLNAIKGFNYGDVTVSDMLLYRTITVGNAGYATFGSRDKDVKLNGVKGYAAKYADGKLTLTEVTNVPAGKGVIIEAAAGSYPPTFDVEAADINSDLKVSNGTITGDGTIYVLNKVDDVVGFYKLNDGRTLEAGKAYLKIENPEARNFIAIDSADATAISDVVTDSADNQYYDLQGRRVAQPAANGLYIVNGKKVIK